MISVLRAQRLPDVSQTHCPRVIFDVNDGHLNVGQNDSFSITRRRETRMLAMTRGQRALDDNKDQG
jgi:hypothetical protein